MIVQLIVATISTLISNLSVSKKVFSIKENYYNIALEKTGYKENLVFNKGNHNKEDAYTKVTYPDPNYNHKNSLNLHMRITK